MRRRIDHVSAERVLSGPGLVNPYNALSELSGAPAAAFTAAQIKDHQAYFALNMLRWKPPIFTHILLAVDGSEVSLRAARQGIALAKSINAR